MRIGYAWHTGSVPQKRRRAEIRAFKSDPECRVFLSTDPGGVGLNLQNAGVVINCDLPWNPAKQAPLAATVLPADPAEAFAQHAARLIGSQLLACEERFPDGASSSVLVVVVDRDAATWGERLQPAFEKLFGNRRSGSPEDLRLEVIDRSTEEAIRRLCETGLLQVRIRATRHLHPNGDASPLPLSDEERARIDSHRIRSRRKLKMGRILAAEELLDEARDAVGEAILSAARASAVRARLPEPESLRETILPPLAACWGESRSLIQRFLEESDHELGSIIQTLESSLPD